MPRPVGKTKEFFEKDRRELKHVGPQSVWQKAVTTRMKELGLSLRKVSERLAEEGQDVSHTRLNHWLNNRSGPPHPGYSRDLNRALAQVIKFDPEGLAFLIDASRAISLYPQMNVSLHALQRIIEESPRMTWEKIDLLEEIGRLA